jgi:hypothetical protein
MEIQLHADRSVRDEDELLAFVGFELVAGLGPCASRVLSAHVDLSLEPGRGPVPSLSCVLEVRPVGHAAFAVTHRGPTNVDAVRGAVVDMRGVLERMFRRIDARRADEMVGSPA